MTHPSQFWDRIAKRYARQPVSDEAAYQKKLSVTRQYLGPASHVLEFGCGTGTTAIYHAPVVADVYAIDISANMLAIAKQKATESGVDNISFEQTDLHALSCLNAHWDVILGMSILHLVENKDAEIQRVYELLKPGGVFISSTVCIEDSGAWFKYVAPIFRWFPFLPTVAVFSERTLKASMETAGFEIEYDWRPSPDKSVFIVARKPSNTKVQ